MYHLFIRPAVVNRALQSLTLESVVFSRCNSFEAVGVICHHVFSYQNVLTNPAGRFFVIPALKGVWSKETMRKHFTTISKQSSKSNFQFVVFGNALMIITKLLVCRLVYALPQKYNYKIFISHTNQDDKTYLHFSRRR